jgi:DNA helicase HerA-like ATPase
MANRHGLIAGATGTGKTITLKGLAESFSDRGIPVFLADIKGDLSGTAVPGTPSPKLEERIEKLHLDPFSFRGYPLVFWDLYGEKGHPVRTTLSEMGPLLLSRLLALNETQTGVMHILFRAADERGLLMVDLKDLKSLIRFATEHTSELSSAYGHMTKQSLGAISRSLLSLEEQGLNLFFGEPDLQISDFIRRDEDGRGIINCLVADRLFLSPGLYATFLLWLLSELYENLPEVGDREVPEMVFFFDEAHLLFRDMPTVLFEKLQLIIRLIRSKGVGIYFCTQNPIDLPDEILAQLGNRIQHALRAYSPKEQRALRAAADTFRENPALDVEEALTSLGVGEALVSFLDQKGIPSVVERAMIVPPHSRMGPLTQDERSEHMARSWAAGRYDRIVDRHSAHEMLLEEERQMPQHVPAEKKKKAPGRTTRKRRTDSSFDRLLKSAASSVGRQIGNQIMRGILGSMKK